MSLAFDTIVEKPLSIVVNCAGTANEHDDWKHNIDLNLTAAIEGTALGVKAFNETKTKGVIVNVSSMAGLFPMSFGPVYSAA